MSSTEPSITYSISIISIEMYPSYNGLTNVIKNVNCRYTGTLGDLTSSIPFSSKLSPPDSNDFIPYTELTKTMVMDWVMSNTNLEFFKTIIKNNIEALQTPTISVIPSFV